MSHLFRHLTVNSHRGVHPFGLISQDNHDLLVLYKIQIEPSCQFTKTSSKLSAPRSWQLKDLLGFASDVLNHTHLSQL